MLLRVVAAIAFVLATAAVVRIDRAESLFAAWIVVPAVGSVFVGNSPLNVVKYRKGMFWIKGFSDEFLAGITRHVA